MKVVISLFIGFLLFTQQDVFCQKKGKLSQPKQKQKLKAKPVPPTLEQLVKLQQYSYPYYAIINNGPSPISGCFISYKNISYFVTTRHSFYTTTNERRKITNVMIFMDPDNMKNNTKVLSLNMTEQNLLPVCFDFGCTDIILLPVIIPKEQSVNYVTLESKENIDGKDMAIVGYIKDSINIIKTRFDSFLNRDSTYFLTEKSSAKDQSGAPVLIYSINKGVSKVTLAGVYSGKEISQELFDKGLVSRAHYISMFLNSKTKEELLGKEQ